VLRPEYSDPAIAYHAYVAANLNGLL